SPGAQFPFHFVAVYMSKDRVQRCRTRRVVRKAQRLGNPSAVIASPFGDGAIATIAAQHPTPAQRKSGGPGRAVALTAAKGWDRGEGLDEGLRLCYHDRYSNKAFWLG